MDTIEIPTGDGVLIIPDSEEARRHFFHGSGHWWLTYPHHEPTAERALTPVGDAIDVLGENPNWKHKDAMGRLIVAAVAAELWLREAERLCPFGYDCQCGACAAKYSECSLSADAMGERIGVIDNVSVARAWGKKGEENHE